MTGWAVTLPYPPSENAYRATRIIKSSGKLIPIIYETREAKQYKKTVAELMATLGRRAFPVFPRGDVTVVARVYRPRRTGDATNRIKVLEDALKGYAWTDDAQVQTFTVQRFDDPANPRAEVEVFAVAQTQGALL